MSFNFTKRTKPPVIPVNANTPEQIAKVQVQMKQNAGVLASNVRPITPKPTIANPSQAKKPIIKAKPTSLPTPTTTKPKPAIKLKLGRTKKALAPVTPSLAIIKPAPAPIPEPEPSGPDWLQIFDAHGNPITLDDSQELAVEKAISGQSFALVGAAGTGKTTTVQAILLAMLEHHADELIDVSYRIQGGSGDREVAPSIAICAFTNKAVRNMQAKALNNPKLKESFGSGPNITTFHNLLEYTREGIWNEELGRETMQFIPSKTADNLLDINKLIAEEASMIGVGNKQIWNQTWDALPEGMQVIILGDINQIPPVGGKPLLSYAIKQLPVVELNKIHRQAAENPIIQESYAVLQGKMPKTNLIKAGAEGVEILSGKAKTKIGHHKLRASAITYLQKAIALDKYDPFEDMVLLPYGKENTRSVTAFDMNNAIGDYLAKKDDSIVWEIRTGFRKLYMRVGERVSANKIDGMVINIRPNPRYTGQRVHPESTTLDYWGMDTAQIANFEELNTGITDFDFSNLDIDAKPDIDADETTSRAASHMVEIQLETGNIVTLSRAGDFADNVFSLGYALTVHKSQGSEWPRVIFIVHDSHQNGRYRELLYTAMTRASKKLIILGQSHTIKTCVDNPRIKGHTLADKIEFFNAGYLQETAKITK